MDSSLVENVQRAARLGAARRVKARDSLIPGAALFIDPDVDAHQVRARGHLDAAAPAGASHARRVSLHGNGLFG